ncbi:hypothetical protein [Sphingopyxis indica]|uniref:Uncharacterized protein n=1 Tax=Sphingopyxis indica TaxID=436663 RepID=A0A239KQ21_9SPHN|nr:hypothetical protein [Sphingopyxis indica]SNT19723.1 hypothetical protein SAMN06295955_11571 [Sphingopyxis indica]
MIRWFKSLFAWRFDHQSGAWSYWINDVTERREARSEGGYSPLDWEWLLAMGLDEERNPLIDGIPAWRSRYRNSLPDGWVWT